MGLGEVYLRWGGVTLRGDLDLPVEMRCQSLSVINNLQ
jgi:hypothetical protein